MMNRNISVWIKGGEGGMILQWMTGCQLMSLVLGWMDV